MGWKVEKIALYLKCSKPTVRETIHRWNQQGLMGLWDAPKTGRKRKWQPEDFREIERKLETEQRTYNSRQLVELLKTERQVSLSERHLRRIIKKNWRWKRTRKSLKGKQNLLELQKKKNDLEMLEWAAATGEICLKYLDESGFSLWSESLYTWAKRGEQN